ncbi:MAG: acetyl-CoA C-acyltransferase, partial [Actinobacteria bacterium]|nr:acetyl-CoA C-acyltransferase [Actinomycetota bacterium]
LAAGDVARELGLRRRLRLVGFATTGVEPHLMGLGPIPATQQLLARHSLSLEDVDAIELNEPFAVQVLAWCDALGVDPADARLNPYGGAIACGHPLAATGARLIAQLAHRLEETGGRYGLCALCVGMGMGVALLWERCDG